MAVSVAWVAHHCCWRQRAEMGCSSLSLLLAESMAWVAHHCCCWEQWAHYGVLTKGSEHSRRCTPFLLPEVVNALWVADHSPCCAGGLWWGGEYIMGVDHSSCCAGGLWWGGECIVGSWPQFTLCRWIAWRSSWGRCSLRSCSAQRMSCSWTRSWRRSRPLCSTASHASLSWSTRRPLSRTM